MNKLAKLALLSAIMLASPPLTQPAMAGDGDAAALEHPSTTAQVRLSSWWFARHAEMIGEIEAAKDPKKDKKIELLKDIPNVTFLDIGAKFLDEEGALSKEMMPDSTQPSEKGHEIWAEAIVPTLKEMRGK